MLLSNSDSNINFNLMTRLQANEKRLDPPNRPKKSKSQSKWKWIGLLCIIGLGILLAVLLVLFLPKADQNGNLNNQIIKDGMVQQPDLSKSVSNLGSFNDDVQPNSYAPKLIENFPYGTLKIRGVNLGGWLVPEPFIVPSLYKDYVEKDKVVDEWTLCETVGKKKCSEILLKHYDSFVTEKEIEELSKAGLNHVRIPFGYWSIETSDDEPFVYGAWEYLLRGIQWCRKYGLRVMIDFHAAPGSQNGWNHSGRLGEARFLNTTNPDSQRYQERFLKIVIEVATFFSKPEWNNVVTQIGVLNEPAVINTKNQDGTLSFYKKSYEAIRAIPNNKPPVLIYHDGFLGPEKWENTLPKDNYSDVTLDIHNYIIFDNDLINKPKEEINDFPCTAWVPQMTKSMKNFGWTMTGEFSVASNDCGPWLNGIGLGARYDGTYSTNKPACPTCTCKDVDDYTKFTSDHRDFLLRFAEKQMDAFESGIGWYFWNFKTENHINPHWDYMLGLKEGWIPRDAGVRSNRCKKSN